MAKNNENCENANKFAKIEFAKSAKIEQNMQNLAKQKPK